MSKINFSDSVSLKEFAHAIGTVGKDVTIIGQGEPGIGKSAMLKVLSEQYPDYETAYIDCTLLDLGDFALPYTENSPSGHMRVTKFAPNARFKMDLDKPVIIMLDEIGKAMKAVKNVLLTLMLEQRVGDHYLPKGSIVFGTTNLMSDGVGDLLEAHARNRICMVTVRKPNADEWIDWALSNKISTEVISWVKQFPYALTSYTDGDQKENPYIFNPTKAGSAAFVTPRSLEKASHIAEQREVLGNGLTISLLSGAIGPSAAKDMHAFFDVSDTLPKWEDIIKSPMSIKIPESAVARCILVFTAIASVKEETLSIVMKFISRLDMEWQALFCTSVARSSSTQKMVMNSKEFKKWAMDNEWVL